KSIVEKAIDKTFNPEFLNRLDEQIFFNELTKEDIEKIIDIELADLHKRVEEAGYKLSLRKSAKRFIADVGYDPRYGARPLKRAIQRYVEDVVAEAILSSRYAPGSTITLTLNRAKNDVVTA
ncbi:MAG: ATP-dependent Clp protease ATP-binding subunit, partial [Bacteroidales bacterium]|nr:ATP-dependent Clp protease ATP-binding subunit [Bacteroidales bacterium]